MTIYFDMDGTIANLYEVDNWLEFLRNENPVPYKAAAPMCNFRQLARLLNAVQEAGFETGIISWLSMDASVQYNEAVRKAKRCWLAAHLLSVDWDEIHLIKYGTPKHKVARDKGGILFDDNEEIRDKWRGDAYEPEEIFEVLKSLL